MLFFENIYLYISSSNINIREKFVFAYINASMEKTVVLLKTHVWSKEIEMFALKIFNETYPIGIDFYVLMHLDDNNILQLVESEKIRKITLKFTEQEIKNLYQSGYYSMWISNHWILMWFYRNYGSEYKYFWSVEYDVRIHGDSSKIWSYNSPCDFLYTIGNYQNANHKYKDFYIGSKISESEKYYGFLQIARYSHRMLRYLDECFSNGENGQDELIIYSLLNRGGFTKSNLFLSSLIRGIWTWDNRYSNYNRYIYESNKIRKNNMELYIFHPIK